MDRKPIYRLDGANEPVRLAVYEAHGGLLLSLQPQARFRFLARPLSSTEQGSVYPVGIADTWINLGYVPPSPVAVVTRHRVSVDWVVRSPEGARRSGVTRILIEVTPEKTARVLQAENRID